MDLNMSQEMHIWIRQGRQWTGLILYIRVFAFHAMVPNPGVHGCYWLICWERYSQAYCTLGAYCCLDWKPWNWKSSFEEVILERGSHSSSTCCLIMCQQSELKNKPFPPRWCLKVKRGEVVWLKFSSGWIWTLRSALYICVFEGLYGSFKVAAGFLSRPCRIELLDFTLCDLRLLLSQAD